MLIDIPFQPHWLHKMLLGLKTCTSRNGKYGNPNDTFRHFGATFTILSVEKYTLDYVANNLYKEEGCDSPDEFKEIWKELHPRKGFVPTQMVWVHFFHRGDRESIKKFQSSGYINLSPPTNL